MARSKSPHTGRGPCAPARCNGPAAASEHAPPPPPPLRRRKVTSLGNMVLLYCVLPEGDPNRTMIAVREGEGSLIEVTFRWAPAAAAMGGR